MTILIVMAVVVMLVVVLGMLLLLLLLSLFLLLAYRDFTFTHMSNPERQYMQHWPIAKLKANISVL